MCSASIVENVARRGHRRLTRGWFAPAARRGYPQHPQQRWLTEALARRVPAPGARALGGTVTRVSSDSYGTMAARPPIAHVELRVSWTPDGDDLGPHLEAWGDVLASAAGLPPLPAGVAALPSRRR